MTNKKDSFFDGVEKGLAELTKLDGSLGDVEEFELYSLKDFIKSTLIEYGEYLQGLYEKEKRNTDGHSQDPSVAFDDGLDFGLSTAQGIISEENKKI